MPRDQRLDAMLDGLLRVAGFLGRRPTWHRSVPIGLHVVNLQKSQFGNQYYLNFGIYVADLGDLTAPKAHQCHFNARADVRDPADERLWKHVLDLDRPMEPEARAQSLGDFETGIELLADPDIAKRIDLEVLRRMCMRMKVGLWVDDPDSYDPELGFYCSASGRISRLSIWEDDGDDDDVMPTWLEVGDWE